MMNADRIEFANTQYYGWAGGNRAELLPSRDQLERAETVVRAAQGRLGDRMDIVYVIPDYYSKFPKPCMDGWASRQFTVVPNGEALPCPAAHEVARGLAPPGPTCASTLWSGSGRTRHSRAVPRRHVDA